jgi:GNAT superfamily N-acetyltransferase
MIHEVDRGTFTREFFDLMAEVECGEHFDPGRADHVQWLHDRIALRFACGARFFASYLDSAPLGFTAVQVEPAMAGVSFTGQYSEIVAIGVRREHRRRGHGSRLIEHSTRFAREQGAYCLYVTTYAGAHDVIAFYERNGFGAVATLPDVHGPRAMGRVYLRRLLRAQEEAA